MRNLLSHGGRLALAVLVSLATVAYAGVWMYASRQPTAYLGIVYDRVPGSPGFLVESVRRDGPAAQAGLRAGDSIREIDGRTIRPGDPTAFVREHGPGEILRVGVDRPGEGRRTIEVRLAAYQDPVPTLPAWIASRLLGFYPLPFLLVGIPVLLLRVEDRSAWLLALLFAGFIAGAPLLIFLAAVPGPLRGPVLAYKVAFGGALPALFLYFFSVFPGRSPLDRRWPWLKTVWLGGAALVSAALALVALASGTARPLLDLAFPGWGLVEAVHTVGGFILGFWALIWTSARGDVMARRKGRVIVWGMLLGFLPSAVLFTVAAVLRREVYQFPYWVWTPCILAMFLMPVSFAYAVVRQRVFGVPALLRRSARYLLVQRGSLALLFVGGVLATLVFALVFGHLQPGTPSAAPAALGAGFGTALVWAGANVHRRVRERIDRAFFRHAYDARVILHDLAERAGAVQSRVELAALLEQHVRDALLPRLLVLYLEAGPGSLQAIGPGALADRAAAALPAVLALAGRGRPEDVLPQAVSDPGARAALVALGADCVVPIPGRQRRLIGILVLGPRLSEEPYSGEDKRLLATVAVQAGIALEGIHLGEQMATRLEAERRATHEMEIAQQVQARLLPQEMPPLATLEYGGRCLQARAVGGDYYDFLDLEPGRVALILADVSGKGFPAALLMANLQASLRSRSALDMMDLPRQLKSVNQLLYRSSEPSRYATLFLGLYDDATRGLRYVNCGHNPPLVLRREGVVDRLSPTATVLGLFSDWDSMAEEVVLQPGDLLAIYSDGVTEAFSDAGEEFGEERLLHALRAGRGLTVPELLDRVVAQVREFSGSEQEDDLTLVIGRVREG